MPKAKDLFPSNYKECCVCHKPLPRAYDADMCPACEEQTLFARVRDYIRSNNVNEYQVADHFGIPVRHVKEWIREGRIEYKEAGDTTIAGVRCQRCGAPVTFGTLCSKCLKLMNGSHGYGVNRGSATDHKMRYVDNEGE